MRLLLLLWLALLTAGLPSAAQAWDLDSVRGAMEARTLQPVEGLWRWAGEGGSAAMVICADGHRPGSYALSVVDSDWPCLDPGTVMGEATAAPDADTYDCRIFSGVSWPGEDGDCRMGRHHDFVCRVDPRTAILELTGYRRSIGLNLWRWVPYLLQKAVVHGSDVSALAGARRQWPAAPRLAEPVVL